MMGGTYDLRKRHRQGKKVAVLHMHKNTSFHCGSSSQRVEASSESDDPTPPHRGTEPAAAAMPVAQQVPNVQLATGCSLFVCSGRLLPLSKGSKSKALFYLLCVAAAGDQL